MQFLRRLGHPTVLFGGGAVLLILSLVLHDPVILPYHVVGAILCYICFLACIIVCAGIGLGRKWSGESAVAWCEVGLLFALETLVTGSWWGLHAWGSAWVWEPRLTGMFLMTLFFLSWRLACAILGKSVVSNRRLTASLIVLGLPSLFFTHVAVRLFGGIHPESVGGMGTGVGVDSVVLVIAGEILLGAGFWGYRIKKMRGGRRMEPQAE